MLRKKSCVVMFVEPDILRYGVIKSEKQMPLIQRQSLIEYHYKDTSDIEVLLTQLKQTMPQNTMFKLNIDITQIQMQSLGHPEIKLTSNEMIIFVESSIYKLFQKSAKNICFDFIDESNKIKQKGKIIVAVCERDYIDEWISLFAKHDLLLQFIGCIIHEQQTVNFLAWRQEQHKKQMFQLSILAISYISLMICLFCYLFIQAQKSLDIYSNELSKQQILEQQLIEKLSNHLPHSSQSQQQVYSSLLLLAKQLPPSIWLDSFHYIPQKITITGNSFTYPEVTRFNHDLLMQIGVENSQIQSVLVNNNHLLFEMDIELNVP